ncbi:hypothetical protein BDZ94DRAFT_1266825 [Collybia nuda]|uniref:Uncharacterized protein n=1 Tax=Collybia nuda TaxID=64659 RepID=A0A9P5XYF4_9AGAR|nr:hypothetical protein BDZ94DRAFT_1266825 [Collybia nuda]
MSRIFSPSDMPDSRGGSESPAELSSASSSDSESREPENKNPSTTKGKAKRRKYVRDPIQRKKILEEDIWATNVTVTSVDCKGCGKTLALDGRRQYYLGLWEKHRVKCPGIRRLRGEEPLPRKPRKTASKRDVDGGSSNDLDMQERKEAGIPELNVPGNNLAPTTSTIQSHSTQYRASSADHLDEPNRNVGHPHHLLASRSMDSLPVGDPEQPGNEWYWREAPFAPPVSNDSSRGRAVYRYSTRWELANGFREYRAGSARTSNEQAEGSGMND